MRRALRFCEVVGWAFWLSLVPTYYYVELGRALFYVAIVLFWCAIPIPRVEQPCASSTSPIYI